MKITLVCKRCRNEYQTYPHNISKSSYCSRLCLVKSIGGSGFINLEGKRFSRLIVKKRLANNKYGTAQWLVQCDCGNTTITSGKCLRNGRVKSCGCLTADRMRTHGLTKKPWFQSWRLRVRRELDANWSLDMEKLLFEIQPNCVVCASEKKLTVDHVKPAIKGNPLQPGNAVRLCKSCNSKKRAKDLSELPLDWQKKITKSAQEFLAAWNNQNH